MTEDSVITENSKTFYIEEFEKIISKKMTPNQDINRTLFWAYEDSIQNKNALLNFSEVIWDKDIEPIVNVCRENGIKEFSISSTFCDLTKILEAFEIQGCKVCGLTRANKHYGRETVPAIKLEVL